MMKYCYENLDIEGTSIADVIATLQAWEDEHPEAENDRLDLSYDGENAYFEVTFQRPMTEEELELHKKQQIAASESQDRHERETYERLKAKFESN